MTAHTVSSTPRISPKNMSDPDLKNATGLDNGANVQAADDDRSSSLSELGDRAGLEHYSRAGSEANDTEAETERLESSPQKQRRQRNVVLTSSNGTYGDQQNQSAARTLQEKCASPAPGSDCERLEQISDISSLEDSADENGKDLSPLCIPLKRKRPSFEEGNANGRDTLLEPSSKATKLFDNDAAGASVKLAVNISSDISAVDRGLQVMADRTGSPSSGEQPTEPQALPKQKRKKGKRKGKRTPNGGPADTENTGSGAESNAEHCENPEAIYSNEEDPQTENVAEGVDVEDPIKMEELVEKKSAMDSLSAIEKCFARLRDKIYEERIAQCNQELAILEQPVPTHHDLLAMKEAVDQRRDQKIEYENNLMRFKLMTLQRESVANKAQAHSQYMQTVREVRDSYLELLNKKIYQVQRERRSCEDDVPDFVYTFTSRRSRQITHQTAYNTEVSILAGIAKHTGFPAAPEIRSARSKEIDDDLQSMGIASSTAQVTRNHRQTLRANLSATAGFSRQRPGAEEHFLEQNPWANAQHPAHHQHRQASGLSAAASRSSTPAGRRRLVDLAEPHGIAEPQSGPNSSIAQTPATGEASKTGLSGRKFGLSESIVGSTPSRVLNGGLLDSTPANLSSSKAGNKQSPSLPRAKSIDRTVLPKPLPFMHTGGSTTSFRTSTPARYPAIGAEAAKVGSPHSPIPHQFHAAEASDGQVNRFLA